MTPLQDPEHRVHKADAAVFRFSPGGISEDCLPDVFQRRSWPLSDSQVPHPFPRGGPVLAEGQGRNRRPVPVRAPATTFSQPSGHYLGLYVWGAVP